uniref:Uncharacterized protein n=1 Tax=Ditylum brightwellii TaxID=49249 RepID=A0A6V2E3J1_9STRA
MERFEFDSCHSSKQKCMLDIRRTFSSIAEKIFISAPLTNCMYHILDKITPIHETSSGMYAWIAALGHLLVDILIMDSILVFTMMVVTSMLEGRRRKGLSATTTTLWNDIQSNYRATVKASWISSTLMSPVQFLSFRYLPVQMRMLVVNVEDVVWDGVVSYQAHKKSRT